MNVFIESIPYLQYIIALNEIQIILWNVSQLVNGDESPIEISLPATPTAFEIFEDNVYVGLVTGRVSTTD